MNFGPNQGPPQVSSVEEQEKENKKKFIEDKFKKLEQELENNFVEVIRTFAQKVIGVRLQYEVLERYNKEPEIAKELYKIGEKKEARSYGVNIDVNSILKEVWVPGDFIKNDTKFVREFQLINGDERGVLNNAISLGLINIEKVREFRSEIDSLERNNRDKKNDFLNDSNYRGIIREYLRSIMQVAKDVSEKLSIPDELNESSKGILLEGKEDYSENEKEYLKALKELCSIYNDEMK